jgi:hypothetical protein
MPKTSGLTLASFAFPLGKQVPGFVVPIFSANGQLFLQEAKAEARVGELVEVEISADEGPLLDARSPFDPNITIQVLDARVPTGPQLIEAFFDGTTITVGTRVALHEYLTESLPFIAAQLANKPLTFAGVLDYVGRGADAHQVRTRRKVIFVAARKPIGSQTFGRLSRGQRVAALCTQIWQFGEKIQELPRSYGTLPRRERNREAADA